MQGAALRDKLQQLRGVDPGAQLPEEDWQEWLATGIALREQGEVLPLDPHDWYQVGASEAVEQWSGLPVEWGGRSGEVCASKSCLGGWTRDRPQLQAPFLGATMAALMATGASTSSVATPLPLVGRRSSLQPSTTFTFPCPPPSPSPSVRLQKADFDDRLRKLAAGCKVPKDGSVSVQRVQAMAKRVLQGQEVSWHSDILAKVCGRKGGDGVATAQRCLLLPPNRQARVTPLNLCSKEHYSCKPSCFD